MCFSASASFGAGVILSAIGVASLKKVQTYSQIPFAAIPLIFAIQQFSEGFLWLSLSDPHYASIQNLMTHIFLFFAQIVWPFWVPFSIFLLQKNEKHKKIGKLLIAIGIVVSLYLAFCLASYHVQAKAIGQHIHYGQEYPAGLSNYGAILYMIATITPPFFSSFKRMWTLGLAILISYIITTIFYEGYIVSVWCFFASVISIAVLAIMQEITNFDKKNLGVLVLK